MTQTRKITSESEAAQLLGLGKLLAFPTETVFGLGADATNEEAVAAIFRAKGRPNDNPLIVHLAEVEDWQMAARTMTDCGRTLLAAFAPGPLTVVLPKSESLSDTCTAGLDSVGIRIPACQYARDILRKAGLPIAAPSANRSGRPSCTTWQSVLEDLDGRIDGVFCQNPKLVGLESTVVDCLRDEPVVLRPGAVTLEDIRKYYPNACLATQLGEQGVRSAVLSPGMRHAHYQPRAQVQLFRTLAELELLVGQASVRTTCCLVERTGNRRSPLPELPEGKGDGLLSRGLHSTQSLMLCRSFENLEDYAAGFYEFLRESDRMGAEQILVHLVEDQGFAQALRDRQLRAAGAK